MATEKKPIKCEQCSKEFVPANKRAKYCSGSCRATASKIRTVQLHGSTLGNAPAQMAAVPGGNNFNPFGNVPPHLQFIIDSQKETIAELKDKVKKKSDKVDSLQSEVSSLKDQMRADETPGGLNGFMQNNPELAAKCLDIFGPMLAKVFTPKETTAIAGASDGDVYKQIAEQFTKYSPETQQMLMDHISYLISIENEADLTKLLSQLMGLFTQGSSMQNYG